MWESDLELVRHILEEIKFCIQSTKNENADSFFKNEILKRAIVRSIEIIGEASKKLDPDFRYEHDHIPWKKMAGMRDVLIHDHMGVDHELVWEVATKHIPELFDDIQALLEIH
ncbi:MAG TPA: HepT-like ribonuclease domain-containing protein [Phnomibacter sp.]|nr:HepT-like ribonuclease domain-containing protein [Phnomibacter sp.]